jgi:hypothetical protein
MADGSLIRAMKSSGGEQEYNARSFIIVKSKSQYH